MRGGEPLQIHGVQRYVDGTYTVLTALDDPVEFEAPAAIYFRNTDCHHCTRFDPEWGRAAPRLAALGYSLYVVTCQWFSSKCASEAAASLFKKYGVTSSPTVLLLGGGGRVARLRGVWPADELVEAAKTFLEGGTPPESPPALASLRRILGLLGRKR